MICSQPCVPSTTGMLTAWKVLHRRLDDFFVHSLVLTSFTAEFLRPGFLCKIKMSMVEMSHRGEQGGVARGGMWVLQQPDPQSALGDAGCLGRRRKGEYWEHCRCVSPASGSSCTGRDAVCVCKDGEMSRGCVGFAWEEAHLWGVRSGLYSATQGDGPPVGVVLA